MIRLAKEDAAKQTESIQKKAEEDVANYQERMVSSIDLQKRTKILAAKQEVIAEVLEKAYEKVKAMSEEEYFSMLLKMVEKYALPQEGRSAFLRLTYQGCRMDLKQRFLKPRLQRAGA